MTTINLIATAPMGLESVVARELKELGYNDLQVENGRVRFTGEPIDICRTNLWLRSAGRILVNMGEFRATTFEELFEGTKALDWPEWIPEDGEFPVNGRSQKSQLTSVPACQSIVKKAVVEKMKMRYGTEWFHEDGGKYVIEVTLMNDQAMLTLDTTGAGLHQRGYRKVSTEAPLRETMAASLVQLSRWQPERPLYDPFCGSGTILIEAAMIGWNIAPGLRRSFNSEGWPLVPDELWDEARDEAFDAVKDNVPLQIAGSDIDPHAIEIAEAAVKKAGFGKEIKLEVLPVAKMKPKGDYGVIITNPPYGERLGDDKEAEKAIRQFGLSSLHLPTWSFFAITPTKEIEHYFTRPADKKRKLFNGRIQTDFYQFFGPLPPRR
ncbi:THUMP domain-containing class I SAM-dependent RNA methyltransferase [Paenibacillus radicis (ex Gao et al. 2016)]|uniref:RNA methyltransferase n=1 Tax=Paenibacillus radicis (ex Gao et al. 2016) TaxID=1737354 RepID=A0A917GSF1_9BACL|nr:class I SAM-dependent RNA methyltransferase [Paenibacillus radicis (ex Gao et al. 2016)]GGG55449.1 RNA methyltransferase [Paenibacillus radicis (ex Gao et al. 2016)]